MNMTRAEAIDWFEQVRDIAKRNLGEKWTRGCEKHYQLKVDLAEAALAALRGPTREMVERMRGEWIEDEFAISHCPLCGYEQEEPELITPFCPLCGSPMTDEAVDMMLRRWREAVSE